MMSDPFIDHDPKARPHLIPRQLAPENQETPIHHIDGPFVPNHLFYRRNHFPYPFLSDSSFLLPIGGAVRNPIVFSYDELKKMPSKELVMTLECAGNRRDDFRPKVFGEQWTNGAINHGVWKGVPLKMLLEKTGLTAEAKEVVFTGYDYGKRPDMKEPVSFARSLPLEKALDQDTLIAYEYNGNPLTFKH